MVLHYASYEVFTITLRNWDFYFEVFIEKSGLEYFCKAGYGCLMKQS